MRFLCARSNSCCMRFKTCSWLFNIVYCSAQWLRVPAVRSHVSELHGHEFVAGFLRIRGSSPRMRGKHLAQYGRGLGGRIIPAHAGQTVGTNTVLSMPSDHPRACGANYSPFSWGMMQFGSSPRMRGKPAQRVLRRQTTRIIPAHAGQTFARRRAACSGTDHPRACGANALFIERKVLRTGSSPRMRGKRGVIVIVHVAERIIPAHAGQTKSLAALAALAADHPRACGANAVSTAAFMWPCGSSPRMRGKRLAKRNVHGIVRIIPAHAGQTGITRSKALGTADHPRTCGANWPGTTQQNTAVGSSPHMRGKPRTRGASGSVARIIPAHAGQTKEQTYIMQEAADHPRTCGANRLARTCQAPRYGSSPHMRGKPATSRAELQMIRIIPAHAGQTARPSGRTSCRPDHPRTCGANILPGAEANTAVGSSPHMRGKQLPHTEGPGHGRIIPAHAGQTPLCVGCH